MFTGIISNIGTITEIVQIKKDIEIIVNIIDLPRKAMIGDSISCNGVCLTITNINNNNYKFYLSKETIDKTNFSSIKIGDKINIEQSVTINKGFDGHIVSGHIDKIGKILKIKKQSLSTIIELEISNKDQKYLIEKGSIALNGISLTINNIYKNSFDINIIPHTINNTILKYLSVEDDVNYEFDMFAKYIEKHLKIK